MFPRRLASQKFISVRRFTSHLTRLRSPSPRLDSRVYASCVKPLPVEDLEHVFSHTISLWEGVRGRRFFITGGTGFFGSWLLETFAYCNRKLALNAEMTVLTRDPGVFLSKHPQIAKESSIKFVRGDVCIFPFPEQYFDFVIHAAVPTSADAASRPMDLMRTIIHGVERVIEFAEASSAKRFLLTSSGAVYGRQPESMSHIRENYLGGPDWLDPNAAYAEGKRVSEQMCSICAKNSDTQFTIARCFAFVGPHLPLDHHFAIGNFIRDALAGRNISIRSDGTPMRSYLYAADLAIWLWTMLFRDAERDLNPTVYNVGSGEAICIRDLARTVVEEINPSVQIEIAGRSQTGQWLEQYVPDVQRADTFLGLRPTIGLREAIRRTATWYR
jgi:nucleoside-diphosphate-sugar epimerase